MQKSKGKPYSIMTPPFEVTSGGIRVMYGLYGWLLAKGQIAFLNATIDADFVAIYPEIYYNNQAGARTVVRYILAEPGEMQRVGVPMFSEYPKEDLLYVFSKMINSKTKVDDNHILFLPIIDTHLFRDYGGKRDKKAVYVGKGTNTNVHPKDCIWLDRAFCQNQAKLADFLNECEVLYCYDYRTALTEVARLCGCRVVIIPSKYTKEQFSLYEPGMNGISWGIEDNQPLDSKTFYEHYMSLKETFSKKLDLLIDETQNT